MRSWDLNFEGSVGAPDIVGKDGGLSIEESEKGVFRLAGFVELIATDGDAAGAI